MQVHPHELSDLTHGPQCGTDGFNVHPIIQMVLQRKSKQIKGKKRSMCCVLKLRGVTCDGMSTPITSHFASFFLACTP